MAPTKEKVSNNIPDDLFFDILSKLPVKSLKRFGCVQKSWADLFENPQFMSMYCNNFLSKDGNNDNACLLLLYSTLNPQHYSLFLISGEKFENKVKLDWPPPLQEGDFDIHFWGPVVNGIVCLCHGSISGPAPEINLKVVLWNPSTEEFKDYPCAPVPSCQIYSLKSNSWRKLDFEMPPHIGSIVYLNGVCHCCGQFKQLGQDEHRLVSFNLSDEVFHTTPLDGLEPRFLMAWDNSIAMVTNDEGDTCFDIFVLGEIGVKESWTKLFTIGPIPCVNYHIKLGKKGDLFYLRDDDEVARFDLRRQTIEELGVTVKQEYSWCEIVTYKESLLPFGGINN